MNKKIFRKVKNGRKRSIYVFGIKVFEYEKKKKYNEMIDKNAISIAIKNFNEIGVTSKKYEHKLIVSLTSYPDRINDIHFSLYSLLNQTLKPNKLILWLADSQFPNKENDLPLDVLNLRKNGLTIKWCKDLRSFKKIIPALREFPDDIIVTADDDIFYDRDWLERLYSEYFKHKDEKFIFAHRNHRITFDADKVNPFMLWGDTKKNTHYEPCRLNFCTTGMGVLCPPHIFHHDILNEQLFFYLTPFHDDLWVWAMAILNGAKVKQVENNIKDIKSISIEREKSSNGKTLYSVNHIMHDLQFKFLCQYYRELIKLLLDDYKLYDKDTCRIS